MTFDDADHVRNKAIMDVLVEEYTRTQALVEKAFAEKERVEAEVSRACGEYGRLHGAAYSLGQTITGLYGEEGRAAIKAARARAEGETT